ncbi:5,10-methenyltetrahydrofolate synthetase [Halobacteroides halobius DSM 5150]|uniref:5-formyltetrahydrofolate cyclo-ligase n=1 Tax=Halobacteroides halobius (strain ATCC 35273 / DSM 5150 / MD-1) TaxID=748449 RepID=L0K8Y8_HALHC|nr:5-formyltetrahydrofolate cyclo-ligase [Halobacteroides halobius]AGB41752.1 5,10-methenyltetrahydrofolate synthetase [Halobacteroides halobius DSM 5150]
MTKDEQRKKVLTKRDRLTKEKRLKKSKQIKKYLFQQVQFKVADRIMFYISFRSEVETELMIKGALDLGKEIVVPIINQEERKMELSLLNNYDQELKHGTYGILEPKDNYIRSVSPKMLDLIVVPGVAFDAYGNRLGYGGGYYDRLFAIVKEVPRIGLGFELQIIDKVITENHDFAVDKVLTEREVYN